MGKRKMKKHVDSLNIHPAFGMLALPADEAFLLDNFRNLTDEKKKKALQFLMGDCSEYVVKNAVINSPNCNISDSFNGS